MNIKNFISEFVEDAILEVIELGGELVDDETFEKRKEICKGCEHFGKVKPLPFVKMDGCTICKCPIKTKGKTKNYFSPEAGRIIKATCPHPDGDKWDF